MNSASLSISQGGDQVVDVIVAATRYPRELLTREADFEDDLGIDSVKRAEIAALLGRRFGLDETQLATLHACRSVGALVDGVAALTATAPFVPAASPSVPVNAVAPAVKAAPQLVLALPESSELLATVQAVVARATRYPIELLTPDADFEDDLGIDSVKFAEIIAQLMKAFPELPQDVADAGTRVRSMRKMAERIAAALPAARRNVPQPSQARALVVITAAPARTGSAERSIERPFTGKVALVTGSGRGLGRVTALELARRGATVIVNSFKHRELGESVAATIREEGGRAHHVWGSMAGREHVDRVFDQIEREVGELDFFVHNASNGAFAKLADASEDDMLKAYRTNVLGLQFGSQRAARLMTRRGGGKILCISSTYQSMTMDYFGVLGPAKAGLEALTRFLAKELMPLGIQVNCIAAGALSNEVMEHYPDHDRIMRDTDARSFGGRRCTEEEVARIQMFMLSREAEVINGTVVTVDRGMAVTAGRVETAKLLAEPAQ